MLLGWITLFAAVLFCELSQDAVTRGMGEMNAVSVQRLLRPFLCISRVTAVVGNSSGVRLVRGNAPSRCVSV